MCSNSLFTLLPAISATHVAEHAADNDNVSWLKLLYYVANKTLKYTLKKLAKSSCHFYPHLFNCIKFLLLWHPHSFFWEKASFGALTPVLMFCACLSYLKSPLSVIFRPQLQLTARRNSSRTGAKKITIPAAQRGHCIDHQALLYWCVFVWQHRQSVYTCMCPHPFMRTYILLCSISLPHKPASAHGWALLSLSNWWSIQIKMNLHHTNRRSGEQSSLQSAGIAGGLSLLSLELLSLNQSFHWSSSAMANGPHCVYRSTILNGLSWRAAVLVAHAWCGATAQQMMGLFQLLFLNVWGNYVYSGKR